MSFYYQSKFKLTNHALTRLKQRDKSLANLSDLMITAQINMRLAKIRPLHDQDNKHLIYMDPKNPQHFFIVTKDHTIITYSKRLINKGDRYN